MQNSGAVASGYGLSEHGIRNVHIAHWNLGTDQLLEHAIRRGEGVLASGGALAVNTGQFTGRSPKDKFIVRDDLTASTVHWGAVNQPMSSEHFARLNAKALAFLQGREVYVQDCLGGADSSFSLPLRVITQFAWHALFARALFIQPDRAALAHHVPEFTLIFVPGLHANPSEDATNSETCIAVDFTRRVVIIAGTSYAGEMKKSVFTILNYLLPERSVMPMHCSANMGARGDVALFFGLSGTGKTTLSSDPERQLIGDDEHGWSDNGVFNFEGGCYAKMIKLSAEAEPQIYATTKRFGTVLENVVIDPDTRALNLDSAALTENTRGAYPLTFIDNAVPSGRAGH